MKNWKSSPGFWAVVFVVLIHLVGFLIPAKAQGVEMDKAVHCLASGGIFTVSFLAVNAPLREKETVDFFLPALITVAVFTTKEILDPVFSKGDMVANCAGLGGAMLTFGLCF